MDGNRRPYFKYCIVPMCKNTRWNAPDKVFFHVPRDAHIRKKWCKIVKRDIISTKSTAYCCEDHFNIEEDTENYTEYKIKALGGQKTILRLKKGIVPHIFQCQTLKPPPKERKVILKRKRQALVEEALSEYALKQCSTQEPSQSSLGNYCEVVPGPSSRVDIINTEPDANLCTPSVNVPMDDIKMHNDKAVQVNIKTPYRSKGVNVIVKKNNVALSPFSVQNKNIATSPLKSTHILNAKKKLFGDNSAEVCSIVSQSSSLSTDYELEVISSESSWLIEEDNLESDKQFKNSMRSSTLSAIEREPKMLLGLPKRSFYLIKLLTENIPLPTIDILITLKKNKLNESFCILALQFGYTQSTVNRIFSKSIKTIGMKMKDLIVWPIPPEIQKNLPISFRARYNNVVSIIDCFEIQIEKPTNVVHQSLTWSQYKKCNTLKYLISCTPDGLVSFISEGYGGRATDVMIVKDCGYLECLPTNKAVMADRGFKDISCLLQNKKCTLIWPPSVLKSTFSTKEDVKQSKRIAALRIHVERVISRL